MHTCLPRYTLFKLRFRIDYSTHPSRLLNSLPTHFAAPLGQGAVPTSAFRRLGTQSDAEGKTSAVRIEDWLVVQPPIPKILISFDMLWFNTSWWNWQRAHAQKLMTLAHAYHEEFWRILKNGVRGNRLLQHNVGRCWKLENKKSRSPILPRWSMPWFWHPFEMNSKVMLAAAVLGGSGGFRSSRLNPLVAMTSHNLEKSSKNCSRDCILQAFPPPRPNTSKFPIKDPKIIDSPGITRFSMGWKKKSTSDPPLTGAVAPCCKRICWAPQLDRMNYRMAVKGIAIDNTERLAAHFHLPAKMWVPDVYSLAW